MIWPPIRRRTWTLTPSPGTGANIFAELSVLALVAILSSQLCVAQNPADATHQKLAEPRPLAVPAAGNTDHCQAIAGGDAQLSPLVAVCRFALTYRHDLPNFICEQTTTSVGQQSRSVLKAQVTFENNHERYSDITLDGKPVASNSAVARSAMMFTSTGELGSDLVDLFTSPIVANFKFRKTAKLRSIPSRIYEFEIPAERNTFWALRDGHGIMLHPEYKGELWVEEHSGRLLRLDMRPLHLPVQFSFASAHVVLDYTDVRIAGAGTFVMPSKSKADACVRMPPPTGALCTVNVLVFHDCRKFGTYTRIITGAPKP